MTKDLRAVYAAIALGAMGFFTQACQWAGDVNLPPQEGLARLIINTLFLHAIAVYIWLFTGPRDWRLRPFHWALFAGIGVALCAMPPVFSGDLHEYLMRGRIFAVYGENPYATPGIYPDDAFYGLTVWVSLNRLPENYGPVWVLIQGIAPALFRNSYPLSLFFFKLILFGFFASSVWLFRRIAQRVYPDRAEWLTGLFALNPNLVSHILIDGHNDIVMVFWMLAAFYSMAERRDVASVVFASLSVLVKFTSVIVLPVVVLYALKSGRYASPGAKLFHAARSALLFLAIGAAFYAPFWTGQNPLSYFSTFDTWFASNSVPYAIHAGLSRLGLVFSTRSVQIFFKAFFALNAFGALAWLASRRPADLRHAALALAWIFLAMYASYTIPFYGHHLLWAFPFLLLGGLPAPLLWVALYTGAGVFFYFKRLSVLFSLSGVLYTGYLLTRRGRR